MANQFTEKGVFSQRFSSWQQTVPELAEQCNLGKTASSFERIIIKPNLVEVLAPPITTPVALVECLIGYLLDHVSQARIIVAEGCGATTYNTHHAFRELGYVKLAEKYRIDLVDLNSAELRFRSDNNCRRWPQMYLPEILDDAFLLSVPQLKAHSLAGVTLTMKNMMGCAPPAHYRGGGAWNKSAFHDRIHEAIYNLNCYRTPDFTLLDATIGMAKAHLWGPQCSPPVNTLAASYDPVAIDSYGTSLLGLHWQDIEHIVLANGELGDAQNYPLHLSDDMC